MKHPDMEILVRYRDSELPAAERTELDLHLSRCGPCRLQLHQLVSVLDDVCHAQMPGPSETMESLQSRIRQWQHRRDDPDRTAEAIRARVAKELGAFFGSRAASSILQPVSPECRNLLSVVEPVLAQFLGARAAAELLDHVVNIAIARV